MKKPQASLEEIVADHGLRFADQLRAAAQWAGSEMDLQIEAEKLLQPFKKEAGIDLLRGRHNHTIGTGRPDSVYGCVIIEYKKPGVLSTRLAAPGAQEVVKQIKDRFQAFRQEEGRPLNSMFGVGCDGRYLVFVRYRDDRWDLQEPVPLDAHSAERFLWALFNMGQKGKPYRAEYLAGDFGAAGRLAGEGVQALYEVLVSTRDKRTLDFFRQWKILFNEVCGFDVDSPGSEVRQLATTYGLGTRAQPAPLFFAVHTYYAFLMKLLAAQVYNHYLRMPSPIQEMMSVKGERLRDRLEELEKGSVFRHHNIRNFLEGDLFSWYVAVWNEPVERLVRNMLTRLDDYNPGTMSEDPAEALAS